MGTLNIIHLSDLHIDAESFSETDAMTDALCKKLSEFLEQRRIDYFDLLIISGDLVNRGSSSYGLVSKVLDKIRFTAGIEPNRIFFVPGNHDVDRNQCNTFVYEKAVEKLIEDPGNFSKLENENPMCEGFVRPFERYSSFAKSFPLLEQDDQAFRLPGFARSKFEIDGLPICLCGLNSALVAGPNDITSVGQPKPNEDLKNRCCGFSYLSEMLSGSKKHLNIVVSHYPLAWIHELERTKVQQLLQQRKAILLTGHIHEHTAEAYGLTDTQLLQLGAGSAYGEKWGGKNHCRILELGAERTDALLHEWIWYGALGWRAFEPLRAQCAGWADCQGMLLRPTGINQEAALQKLFEVGFVDIRKNRTDSERRTHYDRIIDEAEPGSALIVVGRSLIDWASRWRRIQDAINAKGIHVKLGILDENSLPDKTRRADDETNRSWIEQPIPDDWAIDDVTSSMSRLRRITLTGDCNGSLEVYGLPFYVSHSFVAYTNRYDKKRYCAEEAGMALDTKMRPFLEVRSSAYNPDREPQNLYTYAGALEKIYDSMLTPERLLLSANGRKRLEIDTSNRAKIIGAKVEKFGLVDLVIGRDKMDWRLGGIDKILAESPEGGEIFMVGRSLVSLILHKLFEDIIKAIKQKRLQCNLVMADPMRGNLDSIRNDDYAEEDVPQMWSIARSKLELMMSKNSDPKAGYLEIFGIPAYVPVSFASYCIRRQKELIRYCTLEPGLAVTPEHRPFLCFREISQADPTKIGSINPLDYCGEDIYNKLNMIYRGIINDATRARQTKLLFSSKRPYQNIGQPVTGKAADKDYQDNCRGWFIGHFIDSSHGPCSTRDIEIKWGVHKAGEARTDPGVSELATTLTLLISGSFIVRFLGNDTHNSVTLKECGAYVVYPPGVAHTWEALTDCVVLTVRWPSC